MRLRRCGVLLLLLVLVTGCGGGSDDAPGVRPAPADFAPAPMAPEGPLDDRLEADLDAVFSNLETIDPAVIRRIGAARDARAACLVSDLLRFVQDAAVTEDLVGALARLSGTRLDGAEREPGSAWKAVTDRLIAWDLTAPPGHVDYKARLFTIVEPAWTEPRSRFPPQPPEPLFRQESPSRSQAFASSSTETACGRFAPAARTP